MSIWEDEKRIAEKAAIQRAARETSPVSRPTPLSRSESASSPLRAIPVVGPAAGAVVEAVRRLDPTRVVTRPSPATIQKPVLQPASVVPPSLVSVVKQPQPEATQARSGPESRGSLRRTTTIEDIRGPSPADEALAEYRRLMGKEGGGVGEAFVAAGKMKQYQALKPFDIEQEKLAAEQSRVGKELALRREELKSPTSAARERLYGAQAGVAESQLAGEQRKSALIQRLGDVEFQRKDPVGYERLQQYYKALYAPKPADASERAAYIAQGIDPDTKRPLDFSTESYARGGQIPAYGAAPQQNPMLAQYGQYLSAASKSGVAPVPFAKYVQLFESTRSQPEQTIGFQDGGEIPPGYTRPEDVDWGGVLSRGVRGALRMEPKSAPAAEIAPASAPVAADPSENFWTLDPEKRKEIEEAVGGSQGYAKGGAIDVSGRKLLGPGTETSDSIPAVIDGQRPAALSSGEFVIPAHVVRAKGTEFFDKLIAAYADNKGQGDGE